MRAAVVILALLLLGAGGYWLYQRGDLAPVETQPQPQTEGRGQVATEPVTATPAPRFDIVRVDRNGSAVVAGTGAPGATIELLANGEAIGSATIGPDGAWVIQEDTPLSIGPVELTLRQSESRGGPIVGEETVIIYVPEREGDAPIVLRTAPGGATEVLQRGGDDVSDLAPFAIEAIDYDASGSVIFSGRAGPGSTVELSLDGRPLARTTADDTGRWEVPADGVPVGRYRLRAVQYGEDGRVLYRAQVPFERARPEDIVMADGNVVVQPGNNLWVISRAVYGEGEQYTIIFAANVAQIENPDLIYPGQILTVPEGSAPAP